jgi:hypothetical protein
MTRSNASKSDSLRNVCILPTDRFRTRSTKLLGAARAVLGMTISANRAEDVRQYQSRAGFRPVPVSVLVITRSISARLARKGSTRVPIARSIRKYRSGVEPPIPHRMGRGGDRRCRVPHTRRPKFDPIPANSSSGRKLEWTRIPARRDWRARCRLPRKRAQPDECDDE